MITANQSNNIERILTELMNDPEKHAIPYGKKKVKELLIELVQKERSITLGIIVAIETYLEH